MKAPSMRSDEPETGNLILLRFKCLYSLDQDLWRNSPLAKIWSSTIQKNRSSPKFWWANPYPTHSNTNFISKSSTQKMGKSWLASWIETELRKEDLMIQAWLSAIMDSMDGSAKANIQTPIALKGMGLKMETLSPWWLNLIGGSYNGGSMDQPKPEHCANSWRIETFHLCPTWKCMRKEIYANGLVTGPTIGHTAFPLSD